MPGSRLPHTPPYLILGPLPPPLLPLVHKLLPGSLGREGSGSDEGIPAGPVHPATPPLHTENRHRKGLAWQSGGGGGRQGWGSDFRLLGGTAGSGEYAPHVTQTLALKGPRRRCKGVRTTLSRGPGLSPVLRMHKNQLCKLQGLSLGAGALCRISRLCAQPKAGGAGVDLLTELVTWPGDRPTTALLHTSAGLAGL